MASRGMRCIPVVFVTAYTDPVAVERIHLQVPDAPGDRKALSIASAFRV